MYFFFSSRRRHTRSLRDWSSDVCSSDLSVLPRARPEWATLDVLSAGRSILGIGVGWHEDEFELMGVPYKERGRSEERRVGKECRTRWSTVKLIYIQIKTVRMCWIGKD